MSAARASEMNPRWAATLSAGPDSPEPVDGHDVGRLRPSLPTGPHAGLADHHPRAGGDQGGLDGFGLGLEDSLLSTETTCLLAARLGRGVRARLTSGPVARTTTSALPSAFLAT